MRPFTEGACRMPMRVALFFLTVLAFTTSTALAHNVTAGDAGYVQEIFGVHIIPFIYLGAKHMITGYDHILFLLGVVFFLYRMKDVAIYVSAAISTPSLAGCIRESGASRTGGT